MEHLQRTFSMKLLSGFHALLLPCLVSPILSQYSPMTLCPLSALNGTLLVTDEQPTETLAESTVTQCALACAAGAGCKQVAYSAAALTCGLYDYWPRGYSAASSPQPITYRVSKQLTPSLSALQRRNLSSTRHLPGKQTAASSAASLHM